jgi:formamidopyrimidine-DNA glycosylase
VVVGVGNIYANESLFKAGIHPKRAASKVSKQRYLQLAPIIQHTLAQAIEQGGTTLNDFTNADGLPGYFKQELMVYGRGGRPCLVCTTVLKEIRLGQRSTVYCPVCQR